MTEIFGRIFFILAFFACAITRGIGQPVIARLPGETIDLKHNVAIMLTCNGHCYQSYKICQKQSQAAIHQAYCTDSYNWCTSHHCKTSYKGPPVVIPGLLDNTSSGMQGPAATGTPLGGAKPSGGARPGAAGVR